MENIYDEMKPEPVPLIYGLLSMFGSTAFFELINICLTRIYIEDHQRDKDAFWKWKNIFVSWTHSVIITLWALPCLYVFGKDIWRDLIDFHNVYIYCLVAFTTGYFIYDFIDTFRYDKTQFIVLAHHICVVGNFFYNVLSCLCLPIAVIALTVEMNTVFLHLRKLMQMKKVNFDHWFYRCICWINLITFFLIRSCALAVIGYGFYTEGHRLHIIYMAWLWPSWVAMNSLNATLFWKIFKTDVIKYYGKKKRIQVKDHMNNNIERGGVNTHLHEQNSPVTNGNIGNKQYKSS